MLLHGEGGEVDKKNPELLAALEVLCSVIAQYEPECVKNMDETGLFFCLLPRYTIRMPSEDINTTCGKKKSKDCLSLMVCANVTGTHKIPCTVIGKPKAPACIQGLEWPLPY